MAISFPMQQKVAVKALKMGNVALAMKLRGYTNTKKEAGEVTFEN